MDSRKTLVMADFDRVVRAVQEAGGVLPASAEMQPSAAVQPAAAGNASVVVGRVVVAGGETRSLAKTQVWRHVAALDQTIATDDTGERERAEVQVDSTVMHHLSAEVWAGQAKHDSHLRVTTVRSSIVEIAAEIVDVRATEPPALPARGSPKQLSSGDSPPTRLARESEMTTEVLARVLREYSEIRIPRLLRMPTAKSIRITCLGLCMASAAAIAMWPPALGKSAESVSWTSEDRGSQPVAVESTWRPAAQPVAAEPRAAGNDAARQVVARQSEVAAHGADRLADNPPPGAAGAPVDRSGAPSRVAATERVGVRTMELAGSRSAPTGAASAEKPTPAPSGGVSPRAAVDALIAGKQDLALARYRALARSHPSDPVYATAAAILEDAAKRSDDGL